MNTQQWRRGPDRVDRAIAAGALVMMALLLAALVRGSARWGDVPWPIWVHLATITVGLALTPPILLRPRGDRTHRLLGSVWITALGLTAIDSFLIRTILPGRLGPIHLLSAFVLWQLVGAVRAARRHDIVRHRAKLRGIAGGGLLIAGFFTLPPGRMLGSWLLG